MALDAFVKGLLDQMASTPAPKLWEMPASQGREMFRMMVSAMEPPAVSIGKIENITMPGPGGPLKLRIYTPVADGGAALPAIVFFHGGGWVIGDLDTHDALCRALANEAGARVIAVDYRLAPEHKFPGAVDDCFAAVKWIEENASELGGRCFVADDDVDLVRGQGGKKFAGQSFPGHEPERGDFFPGPAHDVGSERFGHAIDDAQMDGARSGRFPAIDDFRHFVAEFENALGVAVDDAAGVVEHHFAAVPREKRGAQRFLQGADLGAQGRRGDVERARGVFQSARPGDGQEVAQVMVVELGVDRKNLIHH